MTYWQTYRPWLLKLLKERIYLSSHGYRSDLLTTAKELKKLMDYHGYRSNQLLAGFMLRKETKIESLIPNNKAYENQISTFRAAIREAAKIAAGFYSQSRTNSHCGR